MAAPIDRNGVQRSVAEGAQLVDVRSAREYEAEHIPGAISLPLTTFGRETGQRLDPTRAVIVYCHDHQ
jgi:phage shock protein E